MFVYYDGIIFRSCSICSFYVENGFWLRGRFCSPWSHWVCLECANWLAQIELHNLDEDEGPK